MQIFFNPSPKSNIPRRESRNDGIDELHRLFRNQSTTYQWRSVYSARINSRSIGIASTEFCMG
jgi:hypothetical protein